MKMSQKRKCGSEAEYKDCKALNYFRGRYYCGLGYKTSKKLNPIEPCLKPMTYKELVEAKDLLKESPK